MSDIKFDSNQVENIINAIKLKNERMNKILNDSLTCVNEVSWEGDAHDAFVACFMDLKNNCDTGYFIIEKYISHLKLSKLAYETSESVLKTLNNSFE